MNKFLPLSLMALLVLTFGVSGTVLAQGTPQDELEAKLDAIDVTDPDQLFEVADWARKNKDGKVRKEGRKLLKEVLELDPEHEGARKALGYVEYDGQWFKNAKDRDKYIMTAKKEEMTGKGYVWLAKGKRKGWIKKDEKRQWKKNWELDDQNIWRSFEYMMEKKGYVQYQGEWLKLSEDDRNRMKRHRDNTGDDIIVLTTEHFKLHLMVPPKFAKEYMELAENIYDWFMEEMKVQPPLKDDFFRGRKMHIWTFRKVQQYQDWITEYAEEYALTEERKKFFREKPGGRVASDMPLQLIVAEKAEDVANPLCHGVGYSLSMWAAMFRQSPFLGEAWGHLTEEHFTKIGKINMTTRSRYANSGGVAQKDYNTKDGRSTARGIVKAREEETLADLAKLGLNSLNGSHLAQGFAILEFMWTNHKDKLIEFMAYLSKQPYTKGTPQEEWLSSITVKAVQHAFQQSPEEFLAAWRKWVLKQKSYR